MNDNSTAKTVASSMSDTDIQRRFSKTYGVQGHLKKTAIYKDELDKRGLDPSHPLLISLEMEIPIDVTKDMVEQVLALYPTAINIKRV